MISNSDDILFVLSCRSRAGLWTKTIDPSLSFMQILWTATMQHSRRSYHAIVLRLSANKPTA